VPGVNELHETVVEVTAVVRDVALREQAVVLLVSSTGSAKPAFRTPVTVSVPEVPMATVRVVTESVRVNPAPGPVANEPGAMFLHADRQAASAAATATVTSRLVIPSSARNQAPEDSPKDAV
jgi:hypothetical protein